LRQNKFPIVLKFFFYFRLRVMNGGTWTASDSASIQLKNLSRTSKGQVEWHITAYFDVQIENMAVLIYKLWQFSFSVKRMKYHSVFW